MAIDKLEHINPYNAHGTIVSGNKFVGREKEIQAIHNRVLGSSYGNLSIIGLPRIGKSSLAWQAIMIHANDLIAKKIITFRLNVSSFSTAHSFYLSAIKHCLDSLADLSTRETKLLEQHILKFRDDHDYYHIEVFFRKIKHLEYRVLAVLDEFDHVANIFQLADFQFLRELSISPAASFCMVTLSRRTIQELEPDDGAISNLFGVFSYIRLQPYSAEDINQYWKRSDECGIPTTQGYRNQINALAGKHPYWMDIVNFHVVSVHNYGNTLTEEHIVKHSPKLQQNLWDHYLIIVELLRDQNLLGATQEVISGMMLEVTQINLHKLEKYGLIERSTSNVVQVRSEQTTSTRTGIQQKIHFKAISQNFEQFVKMHIKESDLWPLWTKTENLLRTMIQHVLEDTYSIEWEDSFLADNPRHRDAIERMRAQRSKSKKQFGSMAADCLVFYSSPSDLWSCFISSAWSSYQPILKADRKTWLENFNYLGKLRNPIAHGNRSFLDQESQVRGLQICRKINDQIMAWRQQTIV